MSIASEFPPSCMACGASIAPSQGGVRVELHPGTIVRYHIKCAPKNLDVQNNQENKSMTTVATKEEYRLISEGRTPLGSIEVVSNIRKTFNPVLLKELAENVKKHGVLSQVIVREGEKGKFILIAGARRLRAAAMAGLADIPYRCLDVTEDQAAEIQAIENLQREGISHIEEARGFQTLINQGKYDVNGLAERISKRPNYVYRAVKLLELPENVLAAIEEGKLTPAHGHQILRVPAEQREEMAASALKPDYNGELPSAKDLMEQIDGADLARATFPINKEYAGEIACTKCPYNSENQGNLFDGAEKGGCTNAPCFTKKTDAAWDEKVVKVEAKYPGVPVIVAKHGVWSGAILSGYDIKAELTEKTKLGKETAIFISRQSGDLWVGKKAPVVVEPETPKLDPAEVAKAQLEKVLTEEATARAIFAKLKAVPAKAWAPTVAYVIDEMYRSQAFIFQAIGLKDGEDAIEVLSKLPAEKLQVLLYLTAEIDNIGAEKLAKNLGLDVKKIAKEAKAQAAVQMTTKVAVK